MTELSHPSPTWQVSQVIEFAADLAEVALPWAKSGEAISDTVLFQFWSEGRQLTNSWLRRIELLETISERRVALDRDLLLASLAHEVFSLEVVARLFGTAFAALDRVRKTPEYRPIAEHVLFAFQHVRARLLTLMLSGDDQHAAADRFRRRCERWTDMLIGPSLVRFGMAAFAHDARRSWEFGEDQLVDSGLNVAQQLVRPSLLTAFRGASGRSPIQSPVGDSFLKTMLATIPSSQLTPRLKRWMQFSVRPTIWPFPQSGAREEVDTGGWSLLERCLNLTERRRTRRDEA